MTASSSPSGRGIRASDADRDRVAGILRDSCVAGRITTDELSDRLDRAYAARTLGDLDALTSDLPQVHRPPMPARAPRPRERASFCGSVPRGLITAIVLVVVLVHVLPWFLLPVLVWVGIGHHHRRHHARSRYVHERSLAA